MINLNKSVETSFARMPLPVNFRPVKLFALEKLPANSPLRTVLLAEKDDLATNEFLAKLQIFLVLLRSRDENASGQ